MSRVISFITIHPHFIEAYEKFGVMASARDKDIARFQAINLRDFAVDRHGTIDGSPYGGGDGMIMRPEPLVAALKSLPAPHRVILLSPAGKLWTQQTAEMEAKHSDHLVFICGRFGGVDQRFIDKYVDEEWSVGDFVVSGGELPALLIVDSILRQCPGVLGNAESPQFDSFGRGLQGLLEAPQYTRPAEFEGVGVPDVLLSGDHQKISTWRHMKSLEVTQKRRPDLMAKHLPTKSTDR